MIFKYLFKDLFDEVV